MHLGDDPAELVVTLEADRTYFDLVAFQAVAESLLGHRVAVTSAGAPEGPPARATGASNGCVSRPEFQAELDAAIHALGEIRRLVSVGGRDAFDAREDRRRAIAWCWVAAGSALKHYSQMTATPQGEPPLSAPIRFGDRPAHQRLDKLDANLLWETSVRETPVLLRLIERLRDHLDRE